MRNRITLVAFVCVLSACSDPPQVFTGGSAGSASQGGGGAGGSPTCKTSSQCDDGNPCTDDSCTVEGKCVNAAIAGCMFTGGTAGSAPTGGTGGAGASAGHGGSAGSTGGAAGSMPSGGSAGTAGTGGSGPTCGDFSVDDDGDGTSENDGDCNDCNSMVNPGAAEIAGNSFDDDCDGKPDEFDDDTKPCDSGLPLNDVGAEHAAKAIGMCDVDGVGDVKFLSSVDWVLADGSSPGPGVDMTKFHLGHGLLDHLGNTFPQQGFRMLGLSSGTARNKNEPGFVSRNYDKGYSGNPPLAFTGTSAACPGIDTPTTSVQDAVGIEFTITPPTNASGFEFVFNFMSYEWPQYICTSLNDAFWANLAQGATDKNISFDGQGDAISVNTGLVTQCACPSPMMGKCIASPDPMPNQPQKPFACTGVDLLQGTDFDGSTNPQSIMGWTNASTGWLKTTATIETGVSFKLRFTVWDSGIDQAGVKDHKIDSTALVDGFKWRTGPIVNETKPVAIQ